MRETKFMNVSLEDMSLTSEYIANIIRSWTKPGVILLSGDMGSGKTTLTRLILERLGVEENVNSPTFAIMNEYRSGTGNNRFYHFDLYRLNHISDLEEMGFDEIWGVEGHSFIEWYDKLPIEYPYPRIVVRWLPSESLDSRSMVIQEWVS